MEIVYILQAFHVFHTSCVVHWILFCEFQIITKELHNKRNAVKYNEIGKDGEAKATRTQDNSVFCPECEGTGIIIEGNELETPNILPSEVCSLWDNFEFIQDVVLLDVSFHFPLCLCTFNRVYNGIGLKYYSR